MVKPDVLNIQRKDYWLVWYNNRNIFLEYILFACQ